MSSPALVDNKKKDILIPAKSSTEGLDNTKLTVEKEYVKKFS